MADATEEDVAEQFAPKLAAKDREIKAMERRLEELKEVLMKEMKRAQDTCKGIEEQVKRFPQPFEYEIQEMKDKYAQMQAGVQQMQMDNMKLEFKIEEMKEHYEKEIRSLEKSLDMAKHLLTEVTNLESLGKLEKGEINSLEQMMGIDLDHDGKVGR
jgi:predicted RNase H-like nuclease (RuvC/YqgF family)